MTTKEYKEKLLKEYAAHRSGINGKGAHAFFEEGARAFETLEQLDFPTKRHEEWKYTTLDRVLKKSPQVASWTTAFNEAWLEGAHIPELDAVQIVLHNGRLQSHQELPEGVSITSVLRDDNTKGEWKAKDGQDIFEHINGAFAFDHIHIEIAAGAVVEKPLYLVNILDAQNDAVLAQRNYSVSVGKSAEATLVERQMTLGSNTSLSNSITHIAVDANAHFHHIVLQNDTEHASQVARTYVNQNRDSRYSNYTYSISGEIVRNNVTIELDEEHTEGNLFGLYLLEGKEHVDNHTLVDHKVPNCESNELYKGVLKDHSIGVFNGKVYVRQDAQKTNAYQQNRNLLLSDNATINTKPQLEIWADDVKCSHGCTVGQLDNDQLFYLKSRGIDGDTARSLMVYAFASEVVERVPLDSVRTYLLNEIASKLNFSLD